MTHFKNLKDCNGCAKRRLEKFKTNGRYEQMQNSNPDKTNFNRPPYYLTVGKKKEGDK